MNDIPPYMFLAILILIVENGICVPSLHVSMCILYTVTLSKLLFQLSKTITQYLNVDDGLSDVSHHIV